MCTAITYRTADFYFGRNLDLEYSHGESVTITPRNYKFRMRNGDSISKHYALIGIAAISDDYPLYYEAANEKGLCIAGLNFPGNATYYPHAALKENIAPFELIPWILCQCSTVSEALTHIKRMNLWHHSFSEMFPLSPLHWLLADGSRSVVLEPLSTGLRIYENPTGVLTNNPPFDYHMYNLANYLQLTAQAPQNSFSRNLKLTPYSLGMGSIGLPGDMSSASRFVRAVFTKENSISGTSEMESISQFFHILSSVSQPRGLTCVKDTEYEFTQYSCCCNASKGIYYYRTYENSQITAVNMHRVDLNGTTPSIYPLIRHQKIHLQN